MYVSRKTSLSLFLSPFTFTLYKETCFGFYKMIRKNASLAWHCDLCLIDASIINLSAQCDDMLNLLHKSLKSNQALSSENMRAHFELYTYISDKIYILCLARGKLMA